VQGRYAVEPVSYTSENSMVKICVYGAGSIDCYLGGRLLAIDPLARSSMSDDLTMGRATEIDWINGEVVRLAAQLGRPAPVNARLSELVHAAEHKAKRPSWSDESLLAELRAAT